MRTHEMALDTGENSDQSEQPTIFTCDDCDIGFSTQRGLKLHRINDHKDAINLDLNGCEECGVHFVNIDDLNAHIQNEHDDIQGKCDICQQEFTSQKLFDEHRFEHELHDAEEGN